MKIWRSAGASLKNEDELKLKMVTPLVALGVGLAVGAAALALFKLFLPSNGRRPK